MKGFLQLENGEVFEGKFFGYHQGCFGEVVFNTAMTGYQEMLSDPSYYGQMVVMTYPLIGNYGINLEDFESDGPKIRALIVRERAQEPSNFRCEMDLDSYLKYAKVTGFEGLDTRKLTRILRDQGTMRGLITEHRMTKTELKNKLAEYDNTDAVYQVSTKEQYSSGDGETHVAVMDFGIKNYMATSFHKRGCRVTVFPADASAEQIRAVHPDGLFLTNGPGNPKDYPQIIETVRKLVEDLPTAGICLGHQLIALALGGDTEKLTFGHRGANHPVKDLKKDKVYITSQNHGYVVKEAPEQMEITHVSMNDQSIEGMRHKTKPIYSVQFHPEASPGPSDSEYIFEEFVTLLKEGK